MVTQKFIKECLDYNPETGAFVWRERPENHFKNRQYQKIMNSRCAGKVAGGKARQRGYPAISLAGKTYRLHRLAFLYMTGHLPSGEVDHINQDREDNRWCNLRDVEKEYNQRNRRRKATTPHVGVSFYEPRGKWRVQICINNKNRHVGYYGSLDDAIAARLSEGRKHGFTDNHGAAL